MKLLKIKHFPFNPLYAIALCHEGLKCIKIAILPTGAQTTMVKKENGVKRLILNQFKDVIDFPMHNSGLKYDLV